jgi:hypothetical protein
VNRQLKAEIFLRFDSQADAARALGLKEPRLSRILHYRIQPSDKERRAFVRVFGEKRIDALLKGEQPPTVAGGLTMKKAHGEPANSNRGQKD